ncbi:TonB-dependent receptor domain-containing protein [Sphingobium sp. TKS]|uniref:TonB-dependent receptor domain-containing protein n=1 Tax=Sphingobium sp. TKS TaxID=1315974 RepID=UPI0007705AEE|nr:TonB-dependent receptor [Sphingobium sp. TKS]AMK21660.1 TonB-dependent receptor [Sphingobium sp. TKS]
MPLFHRSFAGSAIAAVAISIAAPAHAQQAGIEIALVDAETGRPVANAEITVENPGIGYKRSLRSNAQGLVRLDGLSTAGDYQISTASSDQYSASAPATVALRSNFASSVTLRLSPAGTGSIVVTGVRGITGINTVNAEVSASLKREELVALPIEGRDVIGSLIRLPNVVPSTGFFPEAPVVSINGANGLYTNYLIDGLDNNENFLGGPRFPVPLGFTREVTVLANSYSVAYGRTANGIVNYTSPAGGNDYHGEVYALIRPGRPLDATSPFPGRDLTGNPVGGSFQRYQGGFSVGGPIVRDKTFFYANFEATRDHNVQVVDAPTLGTVANVTGENRFYLGSLRLEHRLTDDWTLSLRANFGHVTVDRPGGDIGAGNNTFPSAGSTQDRYSTNIAASAHYAGDEWNYDGTVQYSRFRWNYAKPKGPAGPQVAIEDQTGLTIGTVGSPGYAFNDLEQTWQTTQRLGRRFGNHRISVGADIMTSHFSLFGGGNAAGNYTVRLTPAQITTLQAQEAGLNLGASQVLALNPTVIDYSVELRPQAFGTSQTQLGFYAEDEWHLSPKLTVTAGLRWDYDSLTAKGTGHGQHDNFAPRVAVNYRPDARSSLRFGTGLFYGKIPYTVISDALQRNSNSAGFLSQLEQLQAKGIIPSNVNLQDLTFAGNLAVNPACSSVSACPTPAQVQALRGTATSSEIRILNPHGYQDPYSVQISGGYQFQASSTITLSADVIYSHSYNLVRLRDLNAPAPFSPNLANLTAANIALLQSQPDDTSRQALAQALGLVRSQAAADASRPVALVPGGATDISISDTSGQSIYRAVILQINKARGGDFYAFRLSYTLSKLTNNTDDLNYLAASNGSSDWGPSVNDRRHVISAVGYLYPIAGMTVSVAGLFQSGQPVNLIPDASIFGTQDLSGLGQSFGVSYVGSSDRYPGATRNSGRLPWSKTVDIGLRYALPMLGGRFEVSADIFNVFNTNNWSGFANAATTSNQIQFGGSAPYVQRNSGPPREFQFGASYKF